MASNIGFGRNFSYQAVTRDVTQGETASSAGEVPGDQVVEAVERVAASVVFAKAGRARQLLRYLGRKRLAGVGETVKEYTVALEVFGREWYDSKVDSVVRVEASRLRSLLAHYYESEGKADPLVLEVPKGGYVLQARRRDRSPARGVGWRKRLLNWMADVLAE